MKKNVNNDLIERYHKFLRELYEKTNSDSYERINLSELLSKFHLSKGAHRVVSNKFVFINPDRRGWFKWRNKNQTPTVYEAEWLWRQTNTSSRRAVKKRHQQPFTTQKITIPDQSPCKKLSEFTLSEIMDEVKKRGGTGTLDFVTKLRLTI